MDRLDCFPPHLKIVNIRRGKGNRDQYIYAQLRNEDNDELLISATLDYIVASLSKRSFNLEKTK